MKTKKLSVLSAMLCLSLAVSYAESFIPSFVMGVKPGFANAVTLLVLYAFGTAPAFLISVLRCLLSGILFSGPMSSLYGICGSILAVCTMSLCKKAKISTVFTSSVGAIFHNVGQILCAAVFTKTAAVLLYLPYMTLFGAICGITVGFAVLFLKKPLSEFCDTAKITRPKLSDAAILLSETAVIVILLVFVKSGGNTVKVTVDGNVYGRYSLSENAEIRIDTEYGENVLLIENGNAYIKSADCDGKDCMHGKITENGGEIVCLPHRLIIEIENSTIDAVSQ